MKYKVGLRDEAKDEFDHAYDWYEDQASGLGKDFVSQDETVLERIARNPRSFPVALGDIRKAVVQRFPYFRVDGAQVQVVAVFHSRRDPTIWQSRN